MRIMGILIEIIKGIVWESIRERNYRLIKKKKRIIYLGLMLTCYHGGFTSKEHTK